MQQHQKKVNIQKTSKSNSDNKHLTRAVPYTYKQMMKDLGKASEQGSEHHEIHVKLEVRLRQASIHIRQKRRRLSLSDVAFALA